MFLQGFTRETIPDSGAALAIIVVSQILAILIHALNPQVQAWVRQHWRKLLAYPTIFLLELFGAFLVVGTTVGIAALMDQYWGVDFPTWMLILFGILGAILYVSERVGLRRRLQRWATRSISKDR